MHSNSVSATLALICVWCSILAKSSPVSQRESDLTTNVRDRPDTDARTSPDIPRRNFKNSRRTLNEKLSSNHFQSRTTTTAIVQRDVASSSSPISTSSSISIGRVHMESAKIKGRQDIQQGARADQSAMHTVIFVVKAKDRDALERKLMEVSDPRSKTYGKHLSHAEVTKLTIDPNSVEHIRQSLDFLGVQVTHETRNADYIAAEGTIAQWEELLGAEFYEFHHAEQPGKTIVRALQYSLPSSLAAHVGAVFNVVQFPDVRAKGQRTRHQPFIQFDDVDGATAAGDSSPSNYSSSASAPASTSAFSENVRKVTHNEKEKDKVSRRGFAPQSGAGSVTPALLNSVYSISSNTGSALASQAVYETIDQSYSPSDLTAFQQHFGLPVESVAFDIGGHAANNACAKDGGNDCVEANLDIQYLMGVSQGTPTTYYYWDGDDFMLDWLLAVAEMEQPPLVFSISYGAPEEYFPESYMAQFDLEAMKLGLRGVSIFVSSGDDGAPGSDARMNPLACGYAPDFPAASPYVTSVGGTMGPESGAAKEITCQSDLGGTITSGGSFSYSYRQPDWQREVVQGYLSRVSGTDKEPAPGYDPAGRAYPDISALALNYEVMVSGRTGKVSGTSAAAPVVAAMVSLVNAARLEAGQSSLGWINPALYALYPRFTTDVTSGENNCVASGTVCCRQGFHAAEGWDAVTGLGSLNFSQLKFTFLQIETLFPNPTFAPTPVPGSPTASPTKAPSAAPSQAPTASPTTAPGWMYLLDYSETECSGQVTSVSGVPTGLCMVEYDDDDATAIGSRIYVCTEVGVMLEYYSDLRCSKRFYIGADRFFLGCTPLAQNYYFPATQYSTDLRCEPFAEAPGAVNVDVGDGTLLPVNGAPGDAYSLLRHYSDASCAGPLSSYDAYLEDYCNVLKTNSGTYSYKFSFPQMVYYRGTACRGLPVQMQELKSHCIETSAYYGSSGGDANDDGYYAADDDYYYNFGSVDIYQSWSKLSLPTSDMSPV